MRILLHYMQCYESLEGVILLGALGHSPCPSSHDVVRGLSCLGSALRLWRAVLGRMGTRRGSGSLVETLPSDSQGISQIRSLQWEVATGNLGAGSVFSILQLLCSSAWDRHEPDVICCVLFQGNGAHVLQASPQKV